MKIEIPNDIYEKIKKRSKEKGFKTPKDYIIYILTEVIYTLEQSDERELSKEDEKKIKEELKKLGYIE